MKKNININFKKHSVPFAVCILLVFILAVSDCTREETSPVIQNITVIKSSGNRWHDTHAIVAHALGTVRGRIETNSKEAFTESYESGQRVFEADFSLTSDGFLVVRHDFEEISYYNLEQVPGDNLVMDHETFMKSKIKYLYTHLDADTLCELLTQYPDTYLITDTKYSDDKTVKIQFKLLSEAVLRHDPSLYDRIIVQIYNEAMLDSVKSVYPFGNYIFTVYQIAEPDYEEIGRFCAENQIEVMTIASARFSPAVAETLHSRGVKVYVHTVNRADSMAMMAGYGADGFYSDYITPADYEEIIN
ncbi:MAG: phosphatidylinositol-specific phospholipase C/glycerophosphodiester phosphodiesterase family protein [Eubacteriales bacterium]